VATPRKKKVATVTDESYSKLDQYCIWLYEFHASLMRAGFSEPISRSIISDKECYPDWVEWRIPTAAEVEKYLDDEEY
jgi:hypothetical protein